MLTKIGIKNFECFRELEVAPLRRVNLITGKNNTGKTALLEALTWILHPSPSTGGIPFAGFREGRGNQDWLYYRKDSALTVELDWVLDTGATGSIRSQRGTFNGVKAGLKQSAFSTRPTSPSQDALGFNRVVVKLRKRELMKLLQPLEASLVDLTLNLGTAQGGVVAGYMDHSALIYAELQGLPEMIPVTQLGQGFARLLVVFSEILANDAQVLLVDEIENGIHYSVLPIVWKGLFNAAKEADLQIFATTHSWECILAADQAAREATSYDLSLIRLDRVEGEVKATVMDEKTLSQAREFNWELR